ncbi:MAG: CpsB/CapC family capsule biosynthesis tyrosine phosphatase [Clostridium sp.]|nr:CpsB/CapC family capsule biosynthesis tyrosine phosphatase [Clostridium sp.]MDU7084326.1 CpsB/CapC family capsule biosynthesis tyrosine phosphatase [Clostridium sp.]
MNDFHSHIICGVDDGAKTEEMSLEMLKIAAGSGTRRIVVTPHYIKGRFQVPRKEINEKVEKLKELVKEREIPLEIYGGQEVYYSENILQYYLEGEIGTIEGSRYMLVELPMKGFNSEEVINNFYELQLKGIVVILAHPERYMEFIKKPSLINRFLQEGFLFQLNTGSISGEFGKEVKKIAELFLKNNVYSVIGSDAHRATSRNTDMIPGIEEIERLKPGATEKFNRNVEKILNNEEVINRGRRIEEPKGLKGLMNKIFG